MDVREVLGQARDAMTVKRVFGEPYEKDGVTIIPVASVMGGAGAGGGGGEGAQSEAAGEAVAAGGGAGETGYGMGYGLRATPAGVYVIADGEVEWKPALDANRLMVQRSIVIVVALLILRSIVRTLVRR
jgi:uncharacterized spore protein YtfJ